MNCLRLLLLAVPLLAQTLGQPLGAQTLTDRLKESYKIWEMTLERGEGASVRRSAEALLEKEGLTVSRSDYNEMRSLVTVLDMAARACVADGAWEDAVDYLQKASATAAENTANTNATFSKIRKEHEEKLAEWRSAASKTEARLKDLDAQPGLSQDRMKQRTLLKDFLDEHRNAIAHSEWAIREIDGLLDRVRKDQETDAKSLAAWQAFLTKEKQEIETAGSAPKYVADKLIQVKADETRPRGERIAYARRLLRLDPANRDCRALLDNLLGLDAPSAPPAKPAPARKATLKKP